MTGTVTDKGRSILREMILAGATGVVVFIAILLWNVPGVDPSLWNEVSVAAGVRPPQTVFPGLWRILVGWLFSLFGIEGALHILSGAGAVTGGICAFLTTRITISILHSVIRTSVHYRVWGQRIVPFFAVVAGLVFGLSDPLWRTTRIFSSDALITLLFLVIVQVSLSWYERGSRWRLFPVMGLMGVMAAETPFGFAVPFAFIIGYWGFLHMTVNKVLQRSKGLELPEDLPRWRMFFMFLGGLALAAWANAAEFARLGGLSANGWQATDIYFRYGGGYWHVFYDASSIIGWVLGFGFGLLPLIVALSIFPRTARDDRPMPFNIGAFFFFLGFMAIMQSGAFPAARFWTFTKEIELVNSGFLLTFFLFCSVLTLALFGAAFSMECQRTYLPDDNALPGPLLRWLVPGLTVVLVALVFCHLRRPIETEMQRIVDDTVEEIVRECGDAKYLFTDGHLDAAIELKAAALKSPLKTLNMMSGASEWERTLRCRYFEPGSTDYNNVETGVSVLLRAWAGEKPHGMDDAAIQLGFELWKRDNRPLPRASGLVAREKGITDEMAKEGIAHAKALSDRILAIGKQLDDTDTTLALSDALSAISWRLARFARLRNEETLANDLDLSNTALKKMLSIIEYERMRTFMQLTPREGLQLALRRADFTEARRYSVSVLSYDEDDPEANFAMGMSSLSINRMGDAETYLKKCLKRRPDEPAVLNNLSIICRKQKRYEEAVKYARRASELLPGSAEVQRTLKDALEKKP